MNQETQWLHTEINVHWWLKWDYKGIFETAWLFMWHFKYTKSNKHQGNAIKVKGDRVEKMFVHLGKKKF